MTLCDSYTRRLRGMALESVKHWNNAFTNISCHSEKRRTGNSNEIEQGSILKTTLVEEVYCANDKAIWRVRFEHPSQGPCYVGDHLLPDTVMISDDTQIHASHVFIKLHTFRLFQRPVQQSAVLGDKSTTVHKRTRRDSVTVDLRGRWLSTNNTGALYKVTTRQSNV